MSIERIPTAPVKRIPKSRLQPQPAKSRIPQVPLSTLVEMWVMDGRAQGFSERTLTARTELMRRFVWWLSEVERVSPTLDQLTPDRLRRFLVYCREPRPEGRFGRNHPNARQGTRPSTVQTYYRDLKTFCGFCLAEGMWDESPMRLIRSPRVPKDEIQPFTPEQVTALLGATQQTVAPDRNRTMILVLVDTGLRVSELCSLAVGDVSHHTGELSVVGKGNKRRTVYVGATARRALRQYVLKWRGTAGAASSLFVAEGGHRVGVGLTPSGVRQVLEECGRIARITGVRCSPHTLRHTFAITFLRGGGNLFELQRLMGHTDLTVLRRYVALAESDLAQAHRHASPADRLKLR